MKEISAEKTMTAKEISQSLNIPKKTVMNSISRLFPGKMIHGKTTYLNEKEVTAISMDLKKAHNSASTGTVGFTALERKIKIKQGYDLLMEEVAALTRENEAMKPKAAFYDTVADSTMTISIAEAAKALNIMGRNKLFQFLREHKILMKDNLPYQKYIDRGYFRVIEQAYTKPPKGEGQEERPMVNLKTVVYQKGLDFIRKIIKGS